VDILKLRARERTGRGKSYTRKSRNDGWIPAVFYGKGQETKAIEVEADGLSAIVRGRKTTHLIDLGLGEDEQGTVAIIREIQREAIKRDTLLHVDFQYVAMDKVVTVACPVLLEGIPVGVKEDGGVLEQHARTLEIECMPVEIPERITVDVTSLTVGDSIHVSDLAMPDGVVSKASPDDVVAVVLHPVKEVEPVAGEGEEGEEGEAVEGEGEGAQEEAKEGAGESVKE
jgi:large subunit ribosomal protein L25